MNPNLTLEKAKMLIRQSEAVQEHQAILQQATGTPVVEQIHQKATRRSSHPPHSRNPPLQQQTKCKRCGNKPHLKTNVLQKSPLATNAGRKVTTVASVSQNLYLKSKQTSWKKT